MEGLELVAHTQGSHPSLKHIGDQSRINISKIKICRAGKQREAALGDEANDSFCPPSLPPKPHAQGRPWIESPGDGMDVLNLEAHPQ